MKSTQKFSQYSSNLVIEGRINVYLNNRSKLNTFAYGVF